MNVKRVILIILIILNCTIIFIFSAQDGEKSSQTSSGIVNGIYNRLYSKKIFSPETENEYKDKIAFVIRKGAHFSIYTCLGILTYLYMNTFSIKTSKKILYALIFCFIYACSDEIHQRFSNGRSSEFGDVLLDSFGSLCGACATSKFKN